MELTPSQADGPGSQAASRRTERGRRASISSFLGCTLLALACGGGEQDSPLPPDVVLVVADTLRADRLGATRNGVEVMPRLSRFAERGWRFTSAYSPASWTKPAMVSLLTSLDPEVHRVVFGPTRIAYSGQKPETEALPAGLDTMAAFLARHGYSTAAIQTNPNLPAELGLDRGFDRYDLHPYPELRADGLTDRALAALAEPSGPRFLYVHYMDTHAPYQPPAGHRSAFGPLPELSSSDRELLESYESYYLDRVLHEVGLTPRRRLDDLSPDGEAYLSLLYDGEAHFLDSELGRLLDWIERRQRPTLLLLTADHGEELWDHGSIGHAKTLYQELVHVPLLVRVPGAPARRIDTPAQLIDLLPTVAELLGLPVRADWQGRSLVSSTADADRRPVFASTQMTISGSNVDLECVVLGRSKLILDRHRRTTTLFDLEADPGELEGRTPDALEAAPLLAALAERRRADRAHPSSALAVRHVELPDQHPIPLEALGYLR